MKAPGYDPRQLDRWIADALDGGLDDAGREALNAMLAENGAARAHYRRQMDLHARLHLEYNGGRGADFMPGHEAVRAGRPSPRAARGWMFGAAVAACLALAAVLLPRGAGSAEAFATLESARSARWASSDLPTSEGSRLGPGILHLVEGLAILRFDSGAEISLEGPVELNLVDAMNCRLHHGTAVAKVPDSATGFRIETPSASVIDHGTRFAVSVDPGSGGTLTQVFEGHVEVEQASTGRAVTLQSGQRSSVSGREMGLATDGLEEQVLAREPLPVQRGPEWVVRESAKDAYIGPILENDSEVLLYVKNGEEGFHRKTYLGFDLGDLEPESIRDAELLLQLEPTGLGLASHVPDATFAVYGLVVSGAAWEEASLRASTAPANIERSGAGLIGEEVRKLGSFVVDQGVPRGPFGIRGEALAGFLRERAGSEITLIVVRETAESEKNGLVHGFASRRHPILPGPTLAIRLEMP